MKTKLALPLAFLVTHFFTACWAAEVVIPDTVALIRVLLPPVIVTNTPITGDVVPELAAFDTAVTNFMRVNAIKGGALAVMKDGRLILKHGYGWSDKAKTVPFDPDSRVRIASNSKTFTAAAIKLLIERRVIATNTAAVPFTGIQPYNGRWGDTRFPDITVSHLIAHRSGFNPGDIQFNYFDALALDRPGTPPEIIPYVFSLPLNFSPGTSFSYSGWGYAILGRVIEKASSLNYVHFVQRHVARTWGIHGLTLDRTEPKLRPADEPYYDDSLSGAPGRNLAAFPTEERVALPDGGEYYYESVDSAGGLITSVEGLATLAQTCLISHGSAFSPQATIPTSMNGDRRHWRHISGIGAQSGGEAGARSFNLQNTNGIDLALFFNLDVQEPTFGNFVTQLKRLTETTTNWPGDDTTHLTFASDSFTVGEEENELVIGVRRTGNSQGAVSVDYATVNGTAHEGIDFTAISGTLTFAADEITQSITVPVLNDTRVNGDRTFTLTLTNPAGGAQLGIATATVIIEDDDAPHLPPVVQILSPTDGAISLPGTNMAIILNVNAGSRPINKIEYFAGPTLLGEENKPPYTFTWNKPASGSYVLTAQVTDDQELTVTSAPVVVDISTNPPGSQVGPLLREFWTRRPATTLANLTGYLHFPAQPTGREYLATFEAPSNWGDYYGMRLRGYLLPPATGAYVFWIAADDQAQLWLSSNETAVKKQLIASVPSATSPRQWDRFPAQRSAPITLKAGWRYYVEALHKEGTTSDHLSVGWQLPTGEFERPIPGERLAPFDPAELVPTWSSDEFKLFFHGVPGRTYVIETSSNFVNWLPVQTNAANGLTLEFDQMDAGNFPQRFYRARWLMP